MVAAILLSVGNWTGRLLVIVIVTLFLASCGTAPKNQFASITKGDLFSSGKGRGSSRDEAVEKALLDAVRVASGVLLTEYLRVQQEELHSHEVIQYSVGYVRSFEILDERQGANGSYEVVINAFVSKSALLNFYSGSVRGDGGELAGDQVFHSIQHELNRRESRITILSQLMEDYPARMYKVQLLDQKTRFTDDRKVFVDMKWQISWSAAFLSALYEHFKEMADKVCPMIHDPASYYYSYYEDSCGQFSFIDYEDFSFLDRVMGTYGVSFRFNDEKYVQTFRKIINDQRAYSANVGVYFSFLNKEGVEVINSCIDTKLSTDDYGNNAFMIMDTNPNIFFRNQILSWKASIEIEDVNWLKNVESVKLSVLKQC